MSIRLTDIAKKIDAEIIGAGSCIEIDGAAALSAASVTDISFLSNPKYAAEACASQAAVIIMAKDITQIRAVKLITPNPYLAWAKTLQMFVPDRSKFIPEEIHASATIHPSAEIAAGVHIGPQVSIGAHTRIAEGCIIHAGVVIEEHCMLSNDVVIHPNTVVHHGSRIGKRCVIWSNAVIGADGFGNARDGAKYVAIPQLGNTVLEDDVSIGSGSTIDRGAIEDTIIHRGAKIDNLVMIAHNVEIGADTAIASQTGISGSTKIGDRVMIAGQAGFVGHVHIGDDSFVGAKAGISKSFPPSSKITGYPARKLMDVRRSDSAVKNLPELIKRVKQLEKQIAQLNQKDGA